LILRPYEALPRGTLGNFVLATPTVAALAVMFTVRFPGTQTSEWHHQPVRFTMSHPHILRSIISSNCNRPALMLKTVTNAEQGFPVVVANTQGCGERFRSWTRLSALRKRPVLQQISNC
jgi:hypothetical protein